ncbi:MAG: Holliday junction DNA helicase RuvA [Rhodopirellula sp.]|nr:Holliday junction DNA helicase RuvA [Rhodopirellula sp.]
MITRITGRLVQLDDTAATVAAGPFEYEVLIPEFVRRQLQPLLNQEVSLRTIEYLDGNPQQGRLTPRMVGFMNDAEKEFFGIICQVDGVGVKKALRAMVRPVREVATAIEEQDLKQLATLPGIGAAMAERIVAKLRRKMAKFALLIDRDLPGGTEQRPSIVEDAYEAMLSLGHSTTEAREKIEAAIIRKPKAKSVDELLIEVYRSNRENQV